MKTIFVVTRNDRPDADRIVEILTTKVESAGIRTVDRADDADLIVAVGGDGTVLAAAADAIRLDIPVCGINVGKVGYLAEFKKTEIDDLVNALADDTYGLTSHGVAAVRTADVTAVAVNDVVVEKVISQRIIEVSITINDRKLATYRTDGVIVATPLGSTAYSLSAGGPVVDPSLDALVLTPIAPHSLLARPIVLAPDAVVLLEVADERPARINVDGRELCMLGPGDPIEIRRGMTSVRFLTLGRHPFPQAVREQFGFDHAR